jgi:uncharacterized protein YndB with AHSA1/START domain
VIEPFARDLPFFDLCEIHFHNTFMATTPDGKATTVRRTFSRTTSVQTPIQASKSTIWALLTNAGDYPRWNSTVTSIEGKIEAGGAIRLKSVLDAKRTFGLKIKVFEPEKRMIWGDFNGNRTYTLTDGKNGAVVFSMEEKIGGPIFPLFARLIPPFDESFERFAADLKRAAEQR